MFGVKYIFLFFDHFSKDTAKGLARGQGLQGRELLGELMFSNNGLSGSAVLKAFLV
jgi:hypothetical protein